MKTHFLSNDVEGHFYEQIKSSTITRYNCYGGVSFVQLGMVQYDISRKKSFISFEGGIWMLKRNKLTDELECIPGPLNGSITLPKELISYGFFMQKLYQEFEGSIYKNLDTINDI